MREILTVIKGNFRKNKGSYISIAILMFVVSLSLTAVFSIIKNTNERDVSAMDEVGFGHIIAAVDYQSGIENYEDYKSFCESLAEDIEAQEVVERADLVECMFFQNMI